MSDTDPQPRAPQPTDTELNNVSVLLLDDDMAVRKNVRRMLNQAGALVDTASNGREGLQILMQHTFDVLVVDIRMHEMNGVRFLQEALGIWPWLGVVIITGFPSDPLVVEARKLGVSRILPKPFRKPELVEHVHAEATSKGRRLDVPSCLSLRTYQDQLRTLEEITQTTIRSKTLIAALEALSQGLGRLLPCEVVGILYVEEISSHLILRAQEAASDTLVDSFKANVLRRYHTLSGKAVRDELLETRLIRDDDNGQRETTSRRTFMVPFRTGDTMRGILALLTDEAYTSEDMTFLYHAPNHLSTVFMALERMRQLAVRDGLTGLYNRRHTEETLKEELAQAGDAHPVVVVMIDLDRFKNVNDTHGHLTGDHVLCEFSRMLQHVAPDEAVLGRYGGEEFVVILPNATTDDGVRFAEELLGQARECNFCEDTTPLRLTLSAGIACQTTQVTESQDFDRLLDRADQALYAAKRAGRDRYRVWSEKGFAATGPADTPEEEIAPTNQPVPPPAPPRRKVMIVDDEPSILEVVRRLLELDGYDVAPRSSAERALEELRNPDHGIGIVLTDINMPGKTGLELIEELHQADERVITLVMTGQATVDNAVDSIRYGAYDFIQKPISRQQLSAVVKRAFDYHHLLDENRDYQLHLEDMVKLKSAEVTQSLEETKRFYEFTLEALVGLLDAREQDSGKHSIRVRELALVLGRYLGLPEAALKALAHGALLHDIGKIGIPDTVLRKPGALSPEEREIMEAHPDIGYNILRTAPWLQKAAEIVHSHHEKFDGSGYPRGLRGDNICLGARIFAVVDTYDAMRCERVYRASVPIQEAVTEIKQHTGTQFDPAIVDAFLECQPALEQVLLKLAEAD